MIDFEGFIFGISMVGVFREIELNLFLRIRLFLIVSFDECEICFFLYRGLVMNEYLIRLIGIEEIRK